jgi:hypothetical protein
MEAEMVPGRAGISDEQVTQAAPMVRATVVQRLEMIWRACEPHIDPVPDELGPRKPDPRFVEAGIRVTDRLIALYGLLKPGTSEEEDHTTPTGQVEAAMDRLKELEARLRG